MSGVKRYELDIETVSGCPCICDITEDSNGRFVTYQAYMTLLLEYAEYKQEMENKGGTT